jgi:6-phosphogluconolactonase/glucosamine-6-phosphate isomerase/deaminase
MAAGADKARAIARAQDAATSPAEVPAALLRDRDWLIDAAASAEIESTDRASIRSRTEEGRSRQ